MYGCKLFIGAILPYIVLVTLVVGIQRRISTWSKAPQPVSLTLYPTTGWGIRSKIKETALFPSLFRSDKVLWSLAWSFHVALGVVLLGHSRAVTFVVDDALQLLGVSVAEIEKNSANAGTFAGALLLVSVGALIIRRLLVNRVRVVSTGADFVALLIIVAVVVSGNVMRFGLTTIELSQTREWVFSLVKFSPVIPKSPAVLTHLFCAELLLLYLPFSKLMHLGGFFYSLSLVRRSET
jgi:nitrate reductase gamma subunit